MTALMPGPVRHPETATSSWRLWSTDARLVVTAPDRLREARELCDGILAGIGRVADRFDPRSELSRLSGDGHPQVLSPLLSDLVAEALTAASLTDGAFDPTVGAALVDLGYDRDIDLIQHRGALSARVRRVRGWQTVRLDRDVLSMPPGVRLDLGASAKASAADRCARAVAAATGAGALVSLGGDIATAGLAPEGGWQVGVQDLPSDLPARITLPAGWAVSTSSTRRRTWRQGDEVRHHIVDPATSLPVADTWAAVCVVARTCLAANAASTATVVKGHAGLDWLDAIGLPARLLDGAGRVHRLGGWPEQS
ncbi:FAD:protein FMN transferase [Marmoricola sp. RAF53]|uniref:FAD:protein FMN transferase n=1 Tax=Marmoricola sp. RAF53 TaxID=3233059 RepID=UPI003F9B508A